MTLYSSGAGAPALRVVTARSERMLPSSTQYSCNSLFPCAKCRPNLNVARTLTTNARSRAESDHGLQEVLRIEKEPVWRAVYHASRVHVPKPACGRVSGIKPSGEQAHTQGNECLYRSNRGPRLRKSWLPTFAGKVIFGSVRATSATDLPTLAFTGVARKAWVSPACGPVSTVAIPAICPRSLIWLAMVAKRLELAGNSVLRSVITPSCQMKARIKLRLESLSLPTTWPWLLMPVATAPKSPGRTPRSVSTRFCQRAAWGVTPSALRTCPTIWPWSLMAKAKLERGCPRSGRGKAVPFSHNTA